MKLARHVMLSRFEDTLLVFSLFYFEIVSLAECPACENCSLGPDVYECSGTGQHGNPAARPVVAFALFLQALLFLTTYI